MRKEDDNIKHISFYSGLIQTVGYDPQRALLEVRLANDEKVRQYRNVPEDTIWEGAVIRMFITADTSAGAMRNLFFQGNPPDIDWQERSESFRIFGLFLYFFNIYFQIVYCNI